jgi:hypothetical protein
MKLLLASLHYRFVQWLWRRWQRKQDEQRESDQCLVSESEPADVNSPEWKDWAENRCAMGTGYYSAWIGSIRRK